MTRFAPALLAALLAAPAFADGHSGAHARLEILPGWRTEGGAHMAAIRISLDEGWKTYWRAPGEAGLPPAFDWTGSQNLAEVRFHWPVPEVFASNGMTTLGYHGELVLPIEVLPADPGADVALSGRVALGICQEICMPMEAGIAAVLPDAARDEDRRIAFALLQRPDTAAEAGLVSARCAVEAIADGLRVTARLDLPPVGAGEITVIEAAEPGIWVSEATTRRAENMLTAVADLVPADARPFDLDTRTLRLTVLAEGRAVEIEGCTLVR